jgi:hypothetical protein
VHGKEFGDETFDRSQDDRSQDERSQEAGVTIRNPDFEQRKWPTFAASCSDFLLLLTPGS